MKKEKTIQEKTMPDFGRILPHNTEAEESIIGAAMMSRDVIDCAMSIISSEMFYNKTNEIIFRAIEELTSELKQVDLLTIIDKLRKNKLLDQAGGIIYITEILSKTISYSHFENHIQIIFENYVQRRLITALLFFTEMAFDDSQFIDETLAKLNTELETIQEMIVGKKEIVKLSEAANESIDKMLDRICKQKAGISPGITTGFVDLNRIVNGWKPEKMIILSARPGQGKTSIAIHFATRAALIGHSVLFFSLEMGNTELSDKVIIRESGVNAENYNSGKIEYVESEKAINALTKIKGLPFYIDDTPKMTCQQIVNKARLMRKQGKCDMVIIDYLQLIIPTVKQNRNREQEVSEISRVLKLTAKELKIPFIVLCQMNREFDKEKNREPRLSDIRESGSIEQDADIVIFLHKPDKDSDEIDLCIKKHRAGRLGKVKVKHNDSMTNFFDYDFMEQSRAVSDKTYKNYYEKQDNDNMPF